MDITQQPLLSDQEIQLLLKSSALQNHGHMMSNRFAAAGEHPSEVIGSGMDFADRQPYIAGDDPRFIDWRASARSGKTLIRRYNTELSAPSCVVIDRRPSMLFGTHTRLKATQAIRAGIRCGAQLLTAGQQLACLVVDEQNYWQAASNSLVSFSKTAKHAARACPPSHQASPTHWSHISDLLKQKLTQGSRLILISDFISDASFSLADSKALRYLSQHYNLSLLRITDKAEQNFKQQTIHLNSSSHHLKLNSKKDLKALNTHINEQQSTLSNDIKKLKCAHQIIFTHDKLTHLNVFQN